MNIEIERKFLVDKEKFNWNFKWNYCEEISQYYLTDDIRIRVVYARFDQNCKSIGHAQTFLTLKVKGEKNMIRREFEQEIDHGFYDGLNSLGMEPSINKSRYYCDDKWTVDIFYAKNDGLVLAEIEIDSEDQEIILPDFIGEEVTDDKRYYNSYLANNSYKNWSKDK